MGEFSETGLLLFVGAVGLVQLLFILAAVFALKHFRSEQRKLNRDTYGIMRKIEGLTSRKRDQMAKHFDKILEELSMKLPSTIAARAGEKIFETEKQILSRLAELEPQLRDDKESLEKMDTIIKTMEELEATLIQVTSESVYSVLLENKRSLFSDEDDENLAA